MFFGKIAYYMVFGKIPVLNMLGLITLLLFISSATVAILFMKLNVKKISFKWHWRLAYIALAFGLIHGTLAMLTYLGL